MIVPPRRTAVLSEMAAIAPTQRDRHLKCIAEKGRLAWQKTSGYSRHVKWQLGDGSKSSVTA
jgi:hypothetical protein